MSLGSKQKGSSISRDTSFRAQYACTIVIADTMPRATLATAAVHAGRGKEGGGRRGGRGSTRARFRLGATYRALLQVDEKRWVA
jgi:hypothetical protein